jgi:hypothetical protein
MISPLAPQVETAAVNAATTECAEHLACCHAIIMSLTHVHIHISACALYTTAKTVAKTVVKPLHKTVAKTVANGSDKQLLISINTAMAACSAAGQALQARALLDGMLNDNNAPGAYMYY